MNILIVTQRIDKKDPILGTYHRWVEEFAKHYSKVVVICLEKGEYNLPANVKVLSLGKEERQSRVQYLFRFYKYIWQERKNYDAVFVHMNEEYVLLAGWWWRLVGKRVGMFRNHIQGTWKTPIAAHTASVVYCTSKQSYTARFNNTIIVPAGINIDKFRLKNEPNRSRRSILSIGRVDPVKNVDLFIRALNILNKRGVDFSASVVGDPDPKNQGYYETVLSLGKDLVGKNKLVFSGAVPNTETPKMYQSHQIYVNMTNSGSLDKTIFSAMVSRMLVVICNVNLKDVVGSSGIFKEGDDYDLADKLEYALNMGADEVKKTTLGYEHYVEEEHALEKTIRMIKDSLDEK